LADGAENGLSINPVMRIEFSAVTGNSPLYYAGLCVPKLEAVVHRPTKRRLPMINHGQAPKDIYVRSHLRWYQGQVVEVVSYLKGRTPKMSLRDSDLQLTFGFYQSATG
jgi:hypothetical protein